jgi:Skp family chaperone for outer membrane proteins
MREMTSTAALLGLAALILAPAQAALAAPAAPAPATAAPAATPAPAPAASPAPAAAPAPAPSNGPLIAGVCLLSQEAVVGRSKVGQGVAGRLRDLTLQAQNYLQGEKAKLDARGKALEAKRATLTPLQLQSQAQALNQRAQALQAEAGERQQRLEATKAKALNAVMSQAQPFVAEAYAAHGCGLLFARETLLTGNMGNDLTGEVIAALDAKGTPVTVELEPARPAR